MVDDPAGYGDRQRYRDTYDDGVLQSTTGDTKKTCRISSEKIKGKCRVDDHRKNNPKPIMPNQRRRPDAHVQLSDPRRQERRCSSHGQYPSPPFLAQNQKQNNGIIASLEDCINYIEI